MEQMTSLLAQHGLLLVFVNVLLTQAGIPVPAVPMLVVAGALAAQGEFGYIALLLTALAATLAGDVPWYFAGQRYGHRVLRTLCRISIEPDSCVKQTESIFERWGAPSLIVAKYIPGFSTVAPPLAGAMRLGLPSFLLFSTLGALLWIAVPVALGAVFHAEVEWALERLTELGSGALLTLAVVALLYAGVKAMQRYLFLRMLRAARMTVQELRELLQGEIPPVVVDVRSDVVRRLDPRRIPGAIAVNMENAAAALEEIPPDRDVVVYCS
ncbi:MAG: VTT domain-containing protein [Burkholderiales bacterium]|jgi:membrane protein DedA with SNARE-associated domain|nr:VTT domain-containing protein [Burkholderiales bacterium]